MTDYPITLQAPDIAPYRAGNTGFEWITSFDSGLPGPHVMVTALVHGNEICGAIALDWLFRHQVRPVRGRLSLGFMNVAAYHRFDPSEPAASRFVEEDFNRVWSAAVLDGPRESVELARARAVRPFVDTVDLLLDLHSMQHPTAPLMLAGPLDKGVELARRVGVPQVVMRDQGHAAGRRLRDYDGFGDPASPRNALLVECGQHWEAEAAPVAITTALRFLYSTGVVDAQWGADYLAARPLPRTQRVLQVTQAITVRTDRFVFADDYRGLEVIGRAGTRIAHDGDDPVLTPYDDCVLVMPSRRTRPGETAVRLGRYL